MLSSELNSLFSIPGVNQFRADLHLHSRFSRATSKKLDLAHLAHWAKLKGIQVVGTGDFTHPQWFTELQAQLKPASNQGLFQLASPNSPLFMLQGEISCIYKKAGQVRKVHNLVYMPDFQQATKFCNHLAKIGNLQADGRPILKLDSADLLSLVLDLEGILIPAHVWTPWFAIFGSKSGFDRLEDCFGSQSPEIFALETGLSADPAMFRLCSHLDNYALISNSDAHSGENLGREVNLFRGYPSFNNIFQALKAARQNTTIPDCQFLGTIEFFPQEGKYYNDGHANCNLNLDPTQALAHHNLCPVCNKPLTLGVLHRIQALADRSTPLYKPNDNFISLIPLPEIISQLLAVGSKSQKVQRKYLELLQLFSSELDLLQYTPIADLHQFWPALAQAIAQMRSGNVICTPGYDGIYGQIKIVT